jgi:class 3 adenylate cyclase/tetratricopeptide (TPR) repeat protein
VEATVKCPRCQHPVPDDARFCPECGLPQPRPCPGCGAANALTHRFCAACGHPLAAEPRPSAPERLASRTALEGELKQVTVLFADVKGSLELLAGRDPDEVRQILDPVLERMMEAVHRYEGTVNQVLGDGIMALFGAPLAHEDHAVRACHAALRMQAAIRAYAAEVEARTGLAVQVRVGLHAGRVLVRSIGSDLGMDYTAIGETTHLAARMEQLAPPGAILATAEVVRLADSAIRARPVGPVKVKGLDRPVEVYEVLGAGVDRGRLHTSVQRGLSPFVGRRAELELLQQALARVREGHGEAVALVGEAGIGKSRLVHEFRQSLGGEPVTYLEARCLPYGTTVPFLPLVDMLRATCRVAESDSPEVITAKVQRTLGTLGLDTAEATPYLLRLLGVKEGTEPLEALTPETINARIFDLLSRMLLQGSRRRPVVLVFDDLHWVDQASATYLASVAENLPSAPVLLIVTHRPGYREPWADRSYVSRIALRPLSPRDGMTIVRAVVAERPLADSVLELVVRRAEGNPFFLEEMTRALGAAEAADLAVPDTIHGIIAARIDRLAETPKRLLQVASVLGREVSRWVLESVWDEPAALPDLLAELMRQEFLDEHAAEDGPVYSFRHTLIQEVVYETLPATRRQALHAAAGAALERLYAGRLEEAYDRLAYHWSRTTNAAQALRYLRALAQRAARTFAHAEAVATLQTAFAHVERLPAAEQDRWRAELAILQALSLFLLGRLPETLEVLLRHQAAVERTADAARLSWYHFLLANTCAFLGDLDQAEANAHRALDLATAAGDDATRGKACYVLAVTAYSGGRPARGVEWGRQALARLERAGDPRWEGYAAWALAINLICLGDVAGARETCRRARALGAAVGDPRLERSAAWTLGYIEASAGQWQAGVLACEQGLAASPNPLNTALAQGFLGYACLEGGALERAVPVLEEALAAMTRFGLRQNHGWFQAFLAEAHRRAGDPDRARHLAAEALAVSREARFPFGAGWALRVLGRCARDRGALDEAQAHLEEALATFVRVGARLEAARTHLDLAELARQRGAPTALAGHAAEARALFTALDLPAWAARAEALAGP